jgi:hypothetical protein
MINMVTGRPSGGGQPADLDQLIAALTELRDDPNPVEVARRYPALIKVAPVLLAQLYADAMEKALDLPRMTKAELARQLGIHPSKVYGRTSPRPVTPS